MLSHYVIYKMNIDGNMARWTLIKSDNGPSARSQLSVSVAMPSVDIIIHGGEYDSALKDKNKVDDQ